MDKTRLETLSDGVFAIVITLLILDVRLPDGFRLATNADFWRGLWLVGPNIGAYALSFGLISVFWNAHHTLFRFIRTLDGRLLWLNFGYLLFVTFIPYPTSLLSKAPQLAGAVQLYAGSLLATSVFHPILLLHLRARWRADGTYDPAGWSQSFQLSLVAPFLYATAIILTGVQVRLSYVPLVFVPLFYVIRSWTNTLPPPTHQEPETPAD